MLNFAGNQNKGTYCRVPYPSLGDTVAAILDGTDELCFYTTENLLRSVAMLIMRVASSAQTLLCVCVCVFFLIKSKFLQASIYSLSMQLLLNLSQFSLLSSNLLAFTVR